MSARVPKLGEIVHFILNNGKGVGEHRPAIIVGVQNAYTVDLQVFTNGTAGQFPKNDGLPNVFWKHGAILDDTGSSEGTWHYSEDI